MGALYAAKLEIERAIAEAKLDPQLTLGKIALESGILLALITAATPDDAEKLSKLERAAAGVLGRVQ